MSDEATKQEMDFVDFKPEEKPVAESEQSELEAYYKEREARIAKELIETERSRFKGIQSGEVKIESINDEFRKKLAAWSETRHKAIVEEWGDRAFRGTDRLDFFLNWYNQHPEIALYLNDLEKRSPTDYKKWCDAENHGSRMARQVWQSERNRAQFEKENSPEYTKQLANLARARDIKASKNSDPDHYLLEGLFKDGVPTNELNTLILRNEETRKEAYRLINKAAKLGYCPADSALAHKAQQFVRSESTSVEEAWNQVLGNEVSPEDEQKCRSLFGPGGADRMMKLMKTNEKEYRRMVDVIAPALGILAKKPTAEEAHMLQFRFHK